ncbi:MAG: 50S ribosomal protein L35 [Alphaproteobacteria bacterium]
MAKLKAKSGAKKRFSFTGRGKARRNYAYKRHNLRKRPQKMLRKARGTTAVAKADKKLVRKYLPKG